MPKKGARLPRAGPDPTTIVRGRFYTALAAISQVQSINLSPLTLDVRLLAESDVFSLYRFTSVSVKTWNASIGYDTHLAFSPTVLSATPTLAQFTSLPLYAVGNGQFGSPNPRIHVARRELLTNAPKWFRRGTPYDDLLEVQGQILVGSNAGFSTINSSVLVEYTCELKAQADAALTRLLAQPDPTERKIAELALANHMVPAERQQQAKLLVKEPPDDSDDGELVSPPRTARAVGRETIANTTRR